MSAAARSDITNAIWLCGNCHKLVDDDELRFPAGLLFEWQKEHEKLIGEIVGKTGTLVRSRYERRLLEEFGKLSYLAERIIVEKGDHWEYRLTSEVLRSELRAVLQRWSALKRGLYMKPVVRLPKLENLPWLSGKMSEVQQIAHAFSELLNVEFASAWGEPGVAGDEAHIIETCRLLSEACYSALAWEEEVRFVSVDEIFEELRTLCVGVAGTMIDEAGKIPTFIADLFSGEPKEGVHNLTLVISLPDGWSEAIDMALEKAGEAMLNDIN